MPVDPRESDFLDIGCEKGMCLKCAAEVGYKKVAGIELDRHLLDIAHQNLEKLNIKADCYYASAENFLNYADYDVFYFYNPFGEKVFQQVIEKILISKGRRNRDIWIIYYHPVYGHLFRKAGFALHNEICDSTRDTTARIYHYPK